MSDWDRGQDHRAISGLEAGLPGLALGHLTQFAICLRANLHRLTRARDWRSRLVDAIDREFRFGHDVFFVPVFLGLGAAIWFSQRTPPETAVLIAIAVVALGCAWTARSGARSSRLPALVALVFCGMICAAVETQRLSTIILDQPVVTQIAGIVERREAGSSSEWRYIIRVVETADPVVRRSPQHVSLLAKVRHDPAPIGAWIEGRARLSPPSGPALPGMNDFAFQSFFAQIGAVGYFLGPPQSSTSKGSDDQSWIRQFETWQYQLRDGISNRIRSLLSGDTGAFAASIITGERRSMSREATEALRLSGLAHITAISGLNMALAAGIFFVGARKVLSLFPFFSQAHPVKKLAAAGALLAITAYVMVSGYQVSAVRAYLMTAVMLTAVLIDRPAISLRNLSLAATIMIAFEPSIVMGPSFQMSFAATAALISGYARWTTRPPPIVPKAKTMLTSLVFASVKLISATLTTSVIGAVSTAAFSVWHFHRLSLHGLEANLAAMPLISLVVMPAGFVAMLAMPFGLDEPFFRIMGFGLDLVLAIAKSVAGWGEGVNFARQPGWFIACAVCGLLLVTLLRTWLRLGGVLILLITTVAAAALPANDPADLYVSEDGRLVAVWSDRDAGNLAVNRGKPSAFIYDQWRPVLGIRQTVAPAKISDIALPERPKRGEAGTTATQSVSMGVLMRLLETARPRQFSCIKGACAVLLSGNKILVLERADLVGLGCDLADIVIVAARSPVQACRSGALLFSETILRHTGAVEVWLDRSAPGRISTRFSFAGKPYPWSAHRLYDWRTGESAATHDVTRSAFLRTRRISDSGE